MITNNDMEIMAQDAIAIREDAGVTFKFSFIRATVIRRVCLMLAIAGLLAGCAPRIAPRAPEEILQVPPDFPEAYYRQAEASGSKVLRIDSKRSLLTIYVRRSGSLARLGHDHVVASHNATGYVDITGGRADIYLPLDRLAVDEPGLRAEVGLGTQISDEAIAGTRRNMLDKVLESGRFPFSVIRINRGTTDPSTLTVTITLHGTLKAFEIPAQIESMPGGLKISGQMTFNQTDFGITPFSILGGALQVQDRLDLRFRVIATKSLSPF